MISPLVTSVKNNDEKLFQAVLNFNKAQKFTKKEILKLKLSIQYTLIEAHLGNTDKADYIQSIINLAAQYNISVTIAGATLSQVKFYLQMHDLLCLMLF